MGAYPRPGLAGRSDIWLCLFTLTGLDSQEAKLTLTPNVTTFFEKLAVSHQEVDMPFFSSSKFLHRACARMLTGESVKDLAADLSISDATLYR